VKKIVSIALVACGHAAPAPTSPQAAPAPVPVETPGLTALPDRAWTLVLAGDCTLHDVTLAVTPSSLRADRPYDAVVTDAADHVVEVASSDGSAAVSLSLRSIPTARYHVRVYPLEPHDDDRAFAATLDDQPTRVSCLEFRGAALARAARGETYTPRPLPYIPPVSPIAHRPDPLPIEGRLIAVNVKGASIEITIARGLRDGVGSDWHGWLINGAGARVAGSDFVVGRVLADRTTATIRMTFDQIPADLRAELVP